MDNYEYIQSLVGELMADDEWQFPKDCRFFLAAGLIEQLIYQ